MMYCAFLRGVNVNGRTMKMTEVYDIFRAAGMKDVTSVLATGNIIFGSPDDRTKLCGNLEAALGEHFQMESKLFIKDLSEIKTMLAAVPYTPDPDWHIYAFVCDPGFEQILAKEFESAGVYTDESAMVNDGYFYWRVRRGSTLDTPFSKILGSRKFKEKFTSRNISTIEKVYNKMK